jgi:exodeoxyribonuclease V beta subunit
MNRAPEVPSFDIRGPLPTGTTVLEASAGTGKTFTIAALAARYVAEGTTLDEMLLVTFTRMATGELRDRVRERLVGTEEGLGEALAGASSTGRDEIVGLLADGPREEVQIRRDRLARAVADFDAATIATTHGFCQEVLGGLGIVGDLEADVTFVEEIDDILGETVDDLYVRRFYRHGDPAFDRAEAMRIAEVAVKNPVTPIEPKAAPEESIAAMRRRLADAVRRELEHRKRRTAVMTYDDLLTRLDDTLKGPSGPSAAARLRNRYRVVLVDEFQDTDPVQWDIMRRAFGEGGVTLVLIGDPKQAIYAFRGADVYAYLEAANAADTRETLEVNWRSDEGLIRAYDAIFGGAKLGHEGIVYRKVRAADENKAPRLIDAPVGAPLRFRVVDRGDPSIVVTRKGYVGNDSARRHVAKDLAADLVRLLSSEAQVEIRPQGATPRRERIRPGHVAVLVRTHRNAALVRDELDASSIPAVINGAGSVFAAVSARDWLHLLEAIERPTSLPRAHSAALSAFFGWSAERVACAPQSEWEDVHRRLHQWARTLRARGVAALSETITLVEDLPRRILAEAGGERRLTDLRHIGQLLHEAATAEQMGITALTSWLRRRIAAAEEEAGDENLSRRLESDAEAVQVLTIHRCKGLEFPVVYCPYLWEPSYIPQGAQPIFFHDPEAHDARTIDVGLEGPDFPAHQRQHQIEQRGEDLRMAYVALTRAQHQVVVWWAGTWSSRDSPLGRLLFARDADGNVAPQGTFTPTEAEVTARLEALAAKAPGDISVERSSLGLPTTWAGALGQSGELTAARFDRQLDMLWRRTSYSDITAGTYEPRVSSEPEEVVVSDEPPAAPRPEGPTDNDPSQLHMTRSLLAEMPAGVDVGTFVHRVLQASDFAAADLEAELSAQVAAVLGRRYVEVGAEELVIAGLRAAIETPLGPLLGGTCLRDVSRPERMDEMEFELPLVGGDEPTGLLTLAAIGAVLREHTSPGDPLFGYAERLADPELRGSVRGYLTGSIDLAVRVHDPQGVARFAVLDYKTNWLGGPDGELTAWHYRPSALAAEMQRAHYGLQALLYTTALHRYLRWRIPDYNVESKFAGVLYLFLRGMTGPDTPTVEGAPCGVFAWRPAAPLVEALSDVLDQGGSA